MSQDPLQRVLGRIRTAVAPGAPGDARLLERFLAQRDEAAFAALLERHGPMVLGVCRRVLADEHAAEDVLQATFLLLARKAGSVRKRASVASWLHGVALRLARRAGADAARSRRPDRRPRPAGSPDPLADLSGRELLGILDEELAALPERYRLPLVLCHLEGRARDEAAALLGWSVGQVKGRLERGRSLLRDRLVRRGVSLSVALSATLVSDSLLSAAVPAALPPSLARAAAAYAFQAPVAQAVIPARVLSITEGALQAMFVNRLKVVGAAVLAVALAGSGAGIWVGARSDTGAQRPAPAKAAEKGQPAPGGPNALSGVREEATRQTRENLRRIAIAMHNHSDTFNYFPPWAIYAADGITPLLSWRVALLPYLGEEELYKQFKLDEPWDSPHNKKLLARMPAVYRAPALQPADATTTFYQVIVGNRCVFEEPRPGGFGGPGVGGAPAGEFAPGAGVAGLGALPGMGAMGPGGMVGPAITGTRITQITDGLSNTLLVVEGETAVPWTKPVDIPYSAAGRLPQFGGLFPEVFHAAFADGSVHAIDKQADETILRRLITRDDGISVAQEAVIDPILTSDPEQLRRENQQLADEIAQARRALAELEERHRRASLAQEARGRGEVEVLRLEQKQLKRERDQLRADIERLRNQLRSLGGPGERREEK